MTCCLSNRRVRVNPGDENTTFLHRENPYVAISDIDDNTDYYVSVPQAILEKAAIIDQMTCSMRFICLCDFFISLFYCFYNIFLGIFVACVSFSGYLATIHHKKSLLCCYLFYQGLQIWARLTNLAIYITIYTSPKLITDGSVNGTNSTQTHIIIGTNPGVDITILSGLLLIQIYIFCFVKKYYTLLPTEEEKRSITFNEMQGI